ncbi:DUF2164 domain-containing protein [Paenibacillus sp. HWE-109]|uniref:DUF2164 domain-containing protein n=1 Tax=Paenibacillus sp. HWE-109 TaxID=1306526 RepID=UPI001EDFEC01|nr:DUF2164 domain-containing protein [Paenibacillus sp. HWE-109]UKS29746.1 DUF2164 domain-containing protein [Paenibacillus sp. HWE-109]
MLKLKLEKEQKDQLISHVQTYFYEERSEEIGALSAEFLLDYMIAEIGPYIYNQAIQDALKLVGDKMVALEDDLHAIEKPLQTKRR